MPRRIAVDWPETNTGYCYTNIISKRAHIGISLIDFYCSQYPASGSLNDWSQRIAQGQVTVNDSQAADSYSLRCGDVCKYSRPPWQEPEAPNYLDILYSDEQVVAVCKPSGLQVMPAGPFFQRTALEILRMHFAAAGRPGSKGAPTPVHRLGRGTSGTLLCACTPEARRLLSEAVTHATIYMPLGPVGACQGAGGGAGRLIKKVYRALVTGIITEEQGTVDAAIGPIEYVGIAGGLHAACPVERGGKPALSKYKVLDRDHAAHTTLVEVEIFSGRPHQIRIHMAYIGHPLLGDPVYGPGGVPQRGTGSGGVDGTALSSMPGDCGGYLLHSHILQVPHPKLAVYQSSHSLESKLGDMPSHMSIISRTAVAQYDRDALDSRDPSTQGQSQTCNSHDLATACPGGKGQRADVCAQLDAAGWLLLRAPLPPELMMPEEVQGQQLADTTAAHA